MASVLSEKWKEVSLTLSEFFLKMSLLFAIIGCGNIGKRHAEHIEAVGKLVAVCDIAKSKAEELGKKYGAAAFVSIEELFAVTKSLDVVCVCTPNGLHALH